MSDASSESVKPSNFVRNIVRDDLESGRVQKVVTRFPPEPNGFLHIGHAKSICLNFGLAEEFGGDCHLRFDDTNPEKESQEYIDAIKEDVSWLGFQWSGDVRYTSDYFQTLYEYAIHLIEQGKAYVCDLSPDDIRDYRGTLTEPGRNSPNRDRSVEENLAGFEQMRLGQSSSVLRAKIDMSAPNINMRDPIIYRVRNLDHHQTGDTWKMYPSYDFAHGQSDAIEGISHSVCTLEFEDHRPLYEWLLANLPVPAQPRQYEFSRLNLTYTVMSKRRLKLLVDNNHVDGWDDPRMPTIAGFRRRGYTPEAIRQFCDMIGVTRSEGLVDVAMLEHAIRGDLDKNASRAMCVLDPVKVVITNYPEDKTEMLTLAGHPNRDDLPTRQMPFGREVFIEKEDFREEANKKFKRMVIGKKVRLRGAYVLLAESVLKDDDGNITEIHCSYDKDTLGGDPADGVKPKGVIHWVAAKDCKRITVRLYDRLFNAETPGAGDRDMEDDINPESLKIMENCPAEPALLDAAPESRFQFERTGYFVADRHLDGVYNQTIELRDSWGNG